ncbi:hypothetical protein HQ585_07845 [candidate division KSB1 bacterium]|nr:hypothetical protein [candidate division KSB1 bacterium]
MSRKIRCLTVLCLVFGFHLLSVPFIFAQIAPQPQHPIHVYRDTVDQRLYWPIDKPFWIRLATSPEDNAPSFLLKETDQRSLLDQDAYNSEGIQLEVSGRQFIRWYNFLAKDTVLLKFFTDGEAPVSEITLADAPIYNAGERTYYGNGLGGTLASNDELSGVADIYYSIDGDSFQVYQSALALDQEKSYNIRYYAVDHVGYAEDPGSIEFAVDLTPPKTRHETMINFVGEVLSSSTVFQLISTDAISGLNSIYYRFENEEVYSPFTGEAIDLNNLEDGEHRFLYYAVDHVENAEAPNTFSFYLDKIPPVPSIAVEEILYAPTEGSDYVSPRSRVTFTAEDNKIGVDFIEYSINHDEFSRYAFGFPGPLETGPFTVSYRAVDKLGNLSEAQDLELRMDLTPPKTAYSFTGPNYAQRGVVWLTHESYILLSSVDEGCGVMRTEYKFDQGATTTYTDPINLADEGRYLFQYLSLDNVQNREVDQVVLFIVDNSAPQINETFSIVPIDTVQNDAGETLTVYPRFTSIFLAAIDNSAGIEGIWYRMNGSDEQEFNQTLFFQDEGEFHIEVRTGDNVGNKSEKAFSFMIKD